MNILKLCVVTGLVFGAVAASAEKPNVVIVITDDQGYGDLGCNGNTVIQTPNIDRLRAQGIQLDNYHVDPTCAPTRSALMTGRYSARVGVWHTVQGRNMLREREVTMADIFKDNGYETGIFGKWHLGDCYPYRPEDRGFTYTVYHGAGGVGQAPDYWGNDYFDDSYMKNGTWQKFTGFCTDVWFEEGIAFIEDNVKKDQPFFAYIAPNAPHGPFYCPEEYTKPYEGKEGVSRTEFYGMVTNIDDNMAKLMKRLDELGIADNTILIFTTDNGTSGGLHKGVGFNAGMRGQKNSEYDGGHRVPFIMRWPDGKIPAGKSVKQLTAHLDMLPTFIDLCGLEAPELEFDGTNIRDLLYSDGSHWPDRSLVVESQRVVDPIKWRKSAVMTDQWRLVNGEELFDIRNDPGQVTDVKDQHPEVFEQLRGKYETFWKDVSSEHNLTSYMKIGSDESPVVALSSHDWLTANVPWYQPHIMHGAMAKPAHWAVEVVRDGEYEISLRRWPVEADKPINAANGYKGFDFKQARMRVADVDKTREIPEGAKEVTFNVKLKKGLVELSPLFIGGGREATPYYVYITHQPKAGWQTPEGMGVTVYDPSYGRVPPQRLDQDHPTRNWEPKPGKNQ
ncbi:Arylsulfatase [Pontiella desulfatans]|uniref:Arylsulfatase n=1 Tax=Pontiella desulfatans TaxID=2750659 RepID=A0A6C2U937_PONDE|nr:arylsulfatase [Pontiella desulfatans]SPS74041.1 sulfatase S1_17 [Kiritimatiellales bacterium]VGO16363.1 Arylsulfatase [Pontiella desulfatans]